MADETDFIDLYGKLRLQPDCTLAEFKQAYRRHVAAWHPDRRSTGRADVIAAARLQRLTAQYGAAMEFHRRHGRLPGAALAPRATVAATVTDSTTSADETEPSQDLPPPSGVAGPMQSPRRTMSTRWWLLAAAVGIAIVAWSLVPGTEESGDETSDEQAVMSSPPTHAPSATATFALGSSQSDVLALEGEPTARIDDRWEYGPSWIRFENDIVVDWYSSPLRGLHAATPRPSR